MNLIRRIGSFAAALAGLAAVLLAFGAAPAFATLGPPVPEPGGTSVPAPAPVQVHTVVVGGMAGWQITLIAVAAALLAATAAVLIDRARSSRRRLVSTAAA